MARCLLQALVLRRLSPGGPQRPEDNVAWLSSPLYFSCVAHPGQGQLSQGLGGLLFIRSLSVSPSLQAFCVLWANVDKAHRTL